MNPKEQISKAIIRLMTLNPFFGVLLSSLERIEGTNIVSNGIPTFATDGIRIFYHPDVVFMFPLEEIEAILLHEVLHGIFGHCLKNRIGNRNPDMWNFACDIVVNLEVRAMGYRLPETAYIDYRFAGMLPEQIYELLSKKVGVFVKKFDIHFQLSEEDNNKLKGHILTAWELSKNSIGDLPLGIIRVIKELKSSLVNWQKILHYIVGQALTKEDFCYNIPDKKYIPYEIYIPSLKSYSTSELVIAVDTSGSINNKQLKQFASEIKSIHYLVKEVFIITCDASIQEAIKIEQFENFLDKICFRGGGGTDFRPVFNLLNERRVFPSLLIFLTDGQGRYPEKHPPYPVLWVLTEDYNVPWGNKLVLPMSQFSKSCFI